MPKAKKWTKFYLTLSLRQRRFVNNFLMSCKGYDAQTNRANWNMDCGLYGFQNLYGKYDDAQERFNAAGPLPETPDKPKTEEQRLLAMLGMEEDE